MRRKAGHPKDSAEQAVKAIRRATQRWCAAQDRIQTRLTISPTRITPG